MQALGDGKWPDVPSTPRAELDPQLSTSSTPIAKPYFSTGSEARSRARDLYESLRDRHMVWHESQHLGPSLLDKFLGLLDPRFDDLAKTVSHTDVLQRFLKTAELGKPNEDEFSAAISTVFGRLAKAMEPRLDGGEGVRYVQSGNNGMHARMEAHPWLRNDSRELSDRRLALKPDFFTAKVRMVEGECMPVSLSTKTNGERQQQHVRRSSRIAAQASAPSTPLAVINNDLDLFAWDDVQVLWEIKSNSDALNTVPVLSNAILKAAEVLRFQWHRHFVLTFLVCGTSLRVLRCERGCVLVGAPVDFGGNAAVLVKCLIAGLVTGSAGIGLLVDEQIVELANVDGKPRLVVNVGDQEFILGEQIVGPPKDRLVGRATTVHLARRAGDTSWKYCFKCAWSYAARPHEGIVLQQLQDIPGVVRLFAWDTPSMPDTLSLTPEQIVQDFRLQRVATSGRATPMVETKSLSAPASRRKYPAGAEDGAIEGITPEFHKREYRRSVTKYIKDSFMKPGLTALELLQAWQSLYLVTNSIASRGWVHRDLSWTNVRLQWSPDSSWSTTLIDFDLASRISGTSSGTPDKTGTPTFMPVDILTSTDSFPVRHQELHEDEAAFWIGFLAIISRVPSGLAAVEKLRNPALSMEMLGGLKSTMLLRYATSTRWRTWFGEMEGREGTILKTLCERIVGELFQEEYPQPGVVDTVGVRVHLTMHERVVKRIMEELDSAIGDLAMEEGAVKVR
ncbi:MAG: hypothetical protein M1840_001225 [Geoglossum simile]|nr:MAG: hypothetical protein M1840_001225 [Geoglossum simile]